jgi:hypothetical protein
LAHRRGKIKPKGLWRSTAGLRDKTIANQCSAKKKAELKKESTIAEKCFGFRRTACKSDLKG